MIESILGPEGKNLPPEEIDALIRKSLEQGEGVYRFKEGILEQQAPELVLTQGICDVCAVPYDAVGAAVENLSSPPQILSLNATDMAGILEDIRQRQTRQRNALRAEGL